MAGLTSPQEAKAALRRELLRKRRQLPGRPEKDRAIFQVITALPQYRQARRLYLYVSTGEEPDTRQLLLAALQAGKEVVPGAPGGDGLPPHHRGGGPGAR